MEDQGIPDEVFFDVKGSGMFLIRDLFCLLPEPGVLNNLYTGGSFQEGNKKTIKNILLGNFKVKCR